MSKMRYFKIIVVPKYTLKGQPNVIILMKCKNYPSRMDVAMEIDKIDALHGKEILYGGVNEISKKNFLKLSKEDQGFQDDEKETLIEINGVGVVIIAIIIGLLIQIVFNIYK